MKCVTYNIQYGKGRDNRIDLSRIGDEISGADLITLQEVDRFWPRSGNIDQVQYFRDRFNDYYCVYGAGVDLHVPGSKPEDRQRRQFGNLILSRYPLETFRHHLLPKHGSIGPLSLQRSAIEATIIINGFPVRIYSVHLTHLSAATRLPQVDRILEIHRQAVHEGHAVGGNLSGMDWESGVSNQSVAEHAILFGDFNFQPDSEEYLKMVGPISDYGGHITSPCGFVDAWRQCGNDKFEGPTGEVNDIPARLDYAFVSSAIRHRVTGCRVDESATGSDHLPVWVEFEL